MAAAGAEDRPANRTDAGWEGLAADGSIVRVRPVTPEDGEALHGLCSRSSDRSLYLRFFFTNREAADGFLASYARPVDERHLALVAEQAGSVVALAGWERVGPRVAEVALLVEDAYQGKGIGTLLLEELAARARRQGIEHLVADTLSENYRMQRVFAASGLESSSEQEYGVARYDLSTRLDETALEHIDEREAQAEAASLEPLFAPRAVAVVGAGRSRGGVGHTILRNILDGQFTGAVFPVNPNAFEVAGLPSYAHVTDVPATVDLAVVAVPAEAVPDVLEECGRAGVRAAVVVTSGFGELGGPGAERQRRALEIARATGMRLVGPNCLGLVNTDPAVRLNAWFGRTSPRSGRLAIATQSGAVGIAIADLADRTGLGIASLVSLGNKADVSGNDLLLRWWHDERVGVIALYLESLGNPRKFARLARRVGTRVPVLVVKGGRSDSGRRAGLSHTAASATADVVVDALFAQAGVLRLDTVEEQVDLARLLEAQQLPAGGRLAVIGNGGGVGVLAADAAQAAGLEVPGLSDGLRLRFGPEATDNPVDLGAAVTPGELRSALEAVAGSGEADVLMVALAVTGTIDPAAMLAAVGGAELGDVPVAVTVVGGSAEPTSVRLARGDAAPVYAFPERAVRALARAVGYGRWRRTPAGSVRRPPGLRRESARALVAASMPTDVEGTWLPAPAVTELLSYYGVPVVPGQEAGSAEETVRAAEDIGYPVVLKTGRADIVHKTEVAGVRLGLTGPEQVRAAYAELAGRLGGDVLVQPTVRAVVELVVGVTREATFGPVAVLGMGGVLTDLLADRTYRMLPLTDLDARQMLLGLRCSPVLRGFRGAERVDVEGLEDLLVRVSALAADLPQVAELDLNPVMASGTGAVVVDARVRLAPPEPVPDEAARALRPSPG